MREILRKELIESGNVSSAYTSFKTPSAIWEATEGLKDFFTFSFKYLEPLRDSPKSYHSSDSNISIYDVGLKGEYTASMLYLNSDRIVKYIPPSHFKKKNVDTGTVENKLGVAVSEWLQYLQVASGISSNAQGKLGCEIKIEDSYSKLPYDLTQVGVGVSQVLPILAMGLISNPEDFLESDPKVTLSGGAEATLVFEPPELHLHPKVQSLLGDFFLSLALCRRQCIIETHSEYLINCLRYGSVSSRRGIAGIRH